MSRVIAIAMVILLVCCSAYAEVDLSGMSYDELVALKDQINLAIWNSEEWQEVEIPQGIWIVGEDIPVGMWTVKCSDKSSSTYFSWGDTLNESGTGVDIWGKCDNVFIYNPNDKYYDEGDLTEYTFNAEEGLYVVVDNSLGPAVFTPYAGKPSLGFK